MSAYGISEDTTRDLIDKTQSETIDHLYNEIDKCSDGDINTLRTLLVALFAASMVGLSPDDAASQLTRIVKLLRLNIKVEVENPI